MYNRRRIAAAEKACRIVAHTLPTMQPQQQTSTRGKRKKTSEERRRKDTSSSSRRRMSSSSGSSRTCALRLFYDVCQVWLLACASHCPSFNRRKSNRVAKPKFARLASKRRHDQKSCSIPNHIERHGRFFPKEIKNGGSRRRRTRTRRSSLAS